MNQDNNSGQSGIATLTQQGDTLIVDVSLSKGNADADEGAHIHSGKCGAVGDIIAPLSKVVDGKSHTEIKDPDVTLEKVLAKPHVVNVHSANDGTVYVSCGDIK